MCYFYFCDSSVDYTLNESRQLDLLFETMLQQRVLLNSAKSSTIPDDVGNRNESSQRNYHGYYADYDKDHISNNDYAIDIPGIVNNNRNISNVDWKGMLADNPLVLVNVAFIYLFYHIVIILRI